MTTTELSETDVQRIADRVADILAGRLQNSVRVTYGYDIPVQKVALGGTLTAREVQPHLEGDAG